MHWIRAVGFVGWLGIVGTAAYGILLTVLVDGRWCKLKLLELNSLGDALAGAFGPLAIWWLVLGFFQQRTELRQNSDALSRQALEQKRTADISEANLKYLLAGLRCRFGVSYQTFADQRVAGSERLCTVTFVNVGHECGQLSLRWPYDKDPKNDQHYSAPFLNRFGSFKPYVACLESTTFERTATLSYIDGTGERISEDFRVVKLPDGISIPDQI